MIRKYSNNLINGNDDIFVPILIDLRVRCQEIDVN